MNTLYAFIIVWSLGAGAVSLLAILSKRLRRRAAFAFGACVIAFFVSLGLFKPDRPADTVVASQLETHQKKDEVVEPQALLPTSTLEPPPKLTESLPGIAKICLTDADIHLGIKDELIIPATTVFEDDGPNLGKLEEPTTWRYEIKEGFKFPAKFSILAAVSLRKNTPCAETKVQMLIGDSGGKESMKRASDNHIFVIDDVLDYPIPAQRPFVEIGKLIDDISIQAVLITDVTQAFDRSETFLDREAKAEVCLTAARQLAAHLGGGTGKQTGVIVEIRHVGNHEVIYGCPFGPKQRPDVAIYWKGQPRPPTKTMDIIAKSGEFLTGAARAELQMEMSACVADALKPDAAELANREVRGVKLECQAFSRDGGGGGVTIYRRFGLGPVRKALSPDATAAVNRASSKIEAEDNKKAAEAFSFAEWYQDPMIPQNVKAFAMMAARVISLQQRCPSAKSYDDKINQWALQAGVQPSDIAPGGKYFALMFVMLDQMKAGAKTESVAEACKAIKQYG